MTNHRPIAEVAVDAGPIVTDLQQPLILERNGQPIAVIVSFEAYRRFRALEADEEQRQKIAWLRLEERVHEIHSRPSACTPEEIEAEITAARAEVREMRSGRCSGH
jgi:PHD/YefM family antitoxin component YafN of YafNO toxin-antitoxin module